MYNYFLFKNIYNFFQVYVYLVFNCTFIFDNQIKKVWKLHRYNTNNDYNLKIIIRAHLP